MRSFFGLMLLLTAMPMAGGASAAIIGQQFTAEYRYPDETTPYNGAVFTPASFTAHAGLDTTGVVENVTSLLVDLFDYGLTVTFQTSLSSPRWGNTSFNGIVLTAAGPLGLSGTTVDPGSTFSGFDASRVTLTSNEIQLNWSDLPYQNGTVLSLSFTPVPEPASLILLGAGVAGFGLWRRVKS